MTIALRALSLTAILVAALCISMSGMPLVVGSFRVRDILASLVFLAVAVLAIRSATWLWRRQRFWTERRSLSEVSSLAAAILFWPLVAFMEVRASGAAKDAVHVLFVAVIVAVYIIAQRYAQIPRAKACEPLTAQSPRTRARVLWNADAGVRASVTGNVEHKTIVSMRTTVPRVVAILFMTIGCLELFDLIMAVLKRPPEYAAMGVAWQIGRYARLATLPALSLLGGIGFLRRRNAGRVALIIYCLTAPMLYAWAFAYGYEGLETPGPSAWTLGLLFEYAVSAPFLFYLTRKKTRNMMTGAQPTPAPGA
jgi:hypothetical protein